MLCVKATAITDRTKDQINTIKVRNSTKRGKPMKPQKSGKKSLLK